MSSWSSAGADANRFLPPAGGDVQVAMSRLEGEFSHMLAGLRSITDEDSSGGKDYSLRRRLNLVGDDASSAPPPRAARRGAGRPPLHPHKNSDLFPAEAISDLHAIASRMAAAGYSSECVQAYASIRRTTVESALRRLGVEEETSTDDDDVEWGKIRRWIRAARAAVRGVFASERRLCFLIFHDFPLSSSNTTPFTEAVKGAAQQLLGFTESVVSSIWFLRRSPEKLFDTIDMHDALADLLPDISSLFAASKATESIYMQAAKARSSLADAVPGMLSQFESAILHDPSKVLVPGGAVHPLTRYVINYIENLISSYYKASLSKLITSMPPSSCSRVTAIDQEATPAVVPNPDSQLPPLAAHVAWIIAALEHNLECKAASLYKDAALSHFFLMNNGRYIVDKISDDSSELRGLIGDEYLKRLTCNFRQAAIRYQQSGWPKILNYLKHEGLHVGGGFSTDISKLVLRERFKGFSTGFGEAHKVQSRWYVPDSQLREELRISISEKLLLAYRPFFGKYRHHIGKGKHPNIYIKYSVEDLEEAMADFFEGASPSKLHKSLLERAFRFGSLGFRTKVN